jgi:hypothetical protein
MSMDAVSGARNIEPEDKGGRRWTIRWDKIIYHISLTIANTERVGMN